MKSKILILWSLTENVCQARIWMQRFALFFGSLLCAFRENQQEGNSESIVLKASILSSFVSFSGGEVPSFITSWTPLPKF